MWLNRENKRLTIITAVFIVIALSLVILTYYGNKTLVGARGFIAGEAHWSKAQKLSVLALLRYAHEGDEQYFREFHEHLKVIDGDRNARLTLLSDNPDYQVAFEGFRQGNILPYEIDPMIWMFVKFNQFEFLQEAIGYWEEGEARIDEIIQIAENLHSNQRPGITDETDIENVIQRLYQLDQELTVLEASFAETIGEAANRVNKLIIVFTLLIMITLISASGYITVKYFREVDTLNRQLTVTESKFRNVVENSRDVIYQVDTNSTKYEYMSPSVEILTGFTPEFLISEGPDFILNRIHPVDYDRIKDEREGFTEDQLEECMAHDIEYRLKTKWENYIWVSDKRALVENENGKFVSIVGNMRDISDKKKYVEEINNSLKEKELLLAEIHHRVKNNLAIISSLIEFQKTEPVSSIEEAMNEIQSRIKSIALVHEKLYSSNKFSHVLLSEYIKDLTTIISESYSTKEKTITVEMKLDPLKIEISKALPLGLIYNELINNVYKHAFSDRKNGKVTVNLNQNQNRAVMSVIDNGKGLPEDFSIEKSESLGMTLISRLTSQIDGELLISSNEFTEFRIEFMLN